MAKALIEVAEETSQARLRFHLLSSSWIMLYCANDMFCGLKHRIKRLFLFLVILIQKVLRGNALRKRFDHNGRTARSKAGVHVFDECDDFLECINPSVILLLNDFGKYFISRKRFVKHMRVHLRCSKFLYASAQCVHELVECLFTCKSAMFYFIGKPTRAAEALT